MAGALSLGLEVSRISTVIQEITLCKESTSNRGWEGLTKLAESKSSGTRTMALVTSHLKTGAR